MYEISLVPDVKAVLLQKQKVRNLIILICVGAAIACGVVVAILLGIITTQKISLSNQDKEITCRSTGATKDVKCDSKTGTPIMKFDQLSTLLTIQDQMSNIANLNDQKIRFSRIFGVLDVLLPEGEDTVTIDEMSADFNEMKIFFDAQGVSSNGIGYRSLESFQKGAAKTYFDYGDYMRYNNETSEWEVIPTYCIQEVMENGITYGIYAKGARGCETPMTDSIDPEEGEAQNSPEGEVEGEAGEPAAAPTVELIRIRRDYKNAEDLNSYKEGNDSMAVEGEEIIKGYYFDSKCLVYGDKSIDEEGSHQQCPVVPEDGIMIGDSAYGKDSDGTLVLSFTAAITLNKDIFRAVNHNVKVIGPSRQNVTDSYLQVRDMFHADELTDVGGQ